MRIRKPSAALGATVLLTLGILTVLGQVSQDETKPAGGGRIAFERVISDSEFKLTYGWADFTGEPYSFSFPITKKDLSEAEGEFGYTQEELDRHLDVRAREMNEKMIASLKDFVQKLIDESGFGANIRIVEKDPVTFDLRLSAPEDLGDTVKPVFDSIKKKMAAEYAVAVEKIRGDLSGERKAFIEARGIRVVGEQLSVDYRKSVRNNRPRVRHVLEALRQVDAGLNLRQFLGVSLSFIQDITYGVPSIMEGGRLILGFWVAPKVLVNNYGDCDSKGVAFAALWTNFKKYPAVLIKVPDHMLIGLAIPSLTTEGITINGVRYTLCEVSAGGKAPPGYISNYSSTYLKSGRYQYELIN